MHTQASKSHKTIDKGIKKPTVHTIVSLPNPKQSIILHGSCFWFDDDNKTKYIFPKSSEGKWVNWKHTVPYIVWWITERICLILLTHATKYIWQAFYKFNLFRWVCKMMIMTWCNVQTNGYDLQAKTYPTICTQIHISNFVLAIYLLNEAF